MEIVWGSHLLSGSSPSFVSPPLVYEDSISRYWLRWSLQVPRAHPNNQRVGLRLGPFTAPGPPSGSIYRLWRTTEDLFLWYILHSCYSFLPAIPLLRLAWLLSNPLFPSRVPRYSLSCSLVEGGSAQRTPRRKFHNCNNILSTFEKLDPSFPFNDPVRDKLNKNMHNSCQKFVRLCDFNEDTEPLM